ncbi:MAG: hypothetical protein AABY40_00695, partial [Nanoarchaeota archaeon]
DLQIKDQKESFRMKAVATALMVAAAIGIYVSQYNPYNAPEEFIILREDLNHDQVDDAYIRQENEHKVPMYGLRDGNTLSYKNAEDMKVIRRDDIDYESIEDKLNEKQIVLSPVNYQ